MMNKKNQEKILEEIRKRVLEKDKELRNQQERIEMKEANIEALTELTSLSRKEVEKIAEVAKKEFLIRQKKTRRLITQISTVALIILLIAIYILWPAREQKTTIVTDSFSDNSFSWSSLNSFKYKRYFKNQQYIFETNKDEWCYWDNVALDLPENYDVEVSSKWIKGKYDSYGTDLHKSNTEYLAFTMKADGSASYGKVVDKKWVINDSWKKDKANKDGKQSNLQKVEVRGNNFKYYVNDNLIRTGIIGMEIKNVALRACGEQIVAYEHVKVIDADNNKILFEDDFVQPSEKWVPEKDQVNESYIENGKYVFNCNHQDNCYWAPSALHKITDDCEITLSSVWKSGELATYGFMILENDDNYYSFEYINDGNARLVECKSGEYVYVQSYVKTPYQSDGQLQIKQIVKIKKGKIKYYINDILIEENTIELNFPGRIALRLCGKQSVNFENLSIMYFE